MDEADDHSSGNKASLTDTSKLTLDRLEDISRLLFSSSSFCLLPFCSEA